MWLAFKIAIAYTIKADAGAARPLTFLQTAAFQWVNPKAWIMAVGISAAYLVDGRFGISLVIFCGSFLIAGLCSSSPWALGGTGLRAMIGNQRWVRVINIVLANLLVASLLPIVMELLSKVIF